MIVTKITHKLLQGLAITLVRYANTIEKYLAEKNLTDGQLIAKKFPDEPPAHWLDKVRQGAPDLLNQTVHEIGYNPFFYMANNHQDMQLNSNTINKQQPKFNNNSINESSTRYISKSFLETITKYIYHPTFEKMRYSKNIDNKVDVSDEELVAKNPPNEPPAHWLAKVRQGAPHLLDQTEHEIRCNPASDHQGIELNSSTLGKQQSEFNNNSINESSTRYISKSIVETIRKYIYRPTLLLKRHSNNGAKNMLNLSDEKLIAKKSPSQPPAHWLAKVRQGALDLLDQTPQISASQTSNNLREKIIKYAYFPALAIVKQSKNTEHNSQLLKQKPSKETKWNFFNSINTKSVFATPVKTALKASNLKNTSPPFQKAYDGAGFKKESRSRTVSDAVINPTVNKTEKTEKLHLYPKSQTQACATKTTQNSLENKPASEGIKYIYLSEDKRPDVLHQKVTLFSGNNRYKENVYKLPITNYNRIANTTDALFLNLTSKHNSYQQKSETDNVQYRSPHWPSLPDETVTDTDQDRWPQLPKQEWFKSIDSGDNSLKFWQLQEQAQRNLLSEQEQRGKFWSE